MQQEPSPILDPAFSPLNCTSAATNFSNPIVMDSIVEVLIDNVVWSDMNKVREKIRLKIKKKE
jgi:hypothetical protein